MITLLPPPPLSVVASVVGLEMAVAEPQVVSVQSTVPLVTLAIAAFSDVVT